MKPVNVCVMRPAIAKQS